MRYLLFLFVFISSITLAQNGINYQGAATDSDGVKLADQNISLRTSVLQGGVDGTTSYSETHNTTTDQFGLFNVVIGQGEVVSGEFDSISWGEDAHFLKVELDATGGANYSLVSTTQMMSVPYAKYAENAALDSTNLSDMLASMNISANSGGCDLKFPEGLHGESIIHDLNNYNDYVVPAGKKLYILQFYGPNSDALIRIDDIPIQRSGNHNNYQYTLSNPIIASSGQTISNMENSQCTFNAILIEQNNNVQSVTQDLNNYNDYMVPAGKKLYILQFYGPGSDALIRIDDIPIQRTGNHNNYQYTLSNPIIASSGQTISNMENSQAAFNGFLVDEDYFENCGDGSVSSTPSGLDSAMVADMIAGIGALGSSFGEFISINSSIENQATQDGFLYGNYYCGGSSNSYIKIYCDSFTDNETQRAYIQSNPYGGNFDRHDVFMIPVKKGEYYSFDTGGWNSYITDSYFIPLTGSGTNSTINESSGLDSAMVAEMINQALENNVNGIGIGDYFQGGIVAYIFDEDDAGYVEGEVHGYIISNETYYGIWGCYGIANNINGQNGLENSISISNLCPSSTNQVGGGSCSSISSAEYWLNYSNSGYDDWFLPSFYEVSKVDWSNISVQGIGIILVSSDYNAGGWSSWNGSLYNNQYITTSGTYDFTTKTSCIKSLGFRIF